MTQFSENIKLFRKSKNLTQKQISEIIGIGERAYQYYEAGSREPNMETLIKIADVLDVSTDFLLGRTAKNNSHKL